MSEKPKDISREDWDSLTPFQQLELELYESLLNKLKLKDRLL